MMQSRVRSVLVVAAVVAVSVVAGCASGGGGQRAPDPEARLLEDRAFSEAGRRDVFVERGFRPGARTGVEIRTQLGTPTAVESRPVPNPHDPSVTDSVFTWQYDDLQVEIYRTADGRRFLSQALVTGNQHLTFPEVGIGAPESEVRRLLGTPDADEGGALEYRCEFCPGPTEPAVVTLTGGQVSSIRFFFYVD